MSPGSRGKLLVLGRDFEQGKCPVCEVNWQGEEIPKESQEDYGDTHFSRVIGIEYGEYNRGMDKKYWYDGTSEYVCPDCRSRFGKWTGKILEEGELEERFGGK